MKKYRLRWLLNIILCVKLSLLILSYILYLISFHRVFLIVDNRKYEFQTSKTTIAEVLKERGVFLKKGDRVKPDLNSPVTKDSIIKVSISFPVKIKYYGQTKEIFTLRQPVRKILIDNDIPFSKNDHVTPALDHIIQPGEQINIIRILPKKNPDLAKNKHTSEPAWGVLVTPNGVYRYTRLIFMEATAYYPGPESTSRSRYHGLTCTGKKARYGLVAVDPKVISLGTMLYIEGYGKAEAADTGGAIKGKKIDLCFSTYQEAKRFGRKIIKVYVLKP